MESDEEIGRVPEVGLELGGPSTSGRETASAGAAAGTSSEAQAASAAASAARPTRSTAASRGPFDLAFSLYHASSLHSVPRSCRAWCTCYRPRSPTAASCVRSLRQAVENEASLAFCSCRRGIERPIDEQSPACNLSITYYAT